MGLGILVSKIVGLARTMVFARYLGTSNAAGAYWFAFRIPNTLQNLFGEGVLSASFIPVYSSLLAKGEKREADKVANAVFGMVLLTTSVMVALGVLFSDRLVSTLASSEGFSDQTRALATVLVRLMFPGAGLMVGSAWCLGVLNSHRRFFLSYASPVVWNLAQIAALLYFGRYRAGTDAAGAQAEAQLTVYLSYGMVVGSLLQFLAQLPTVLSLLGSFRPSLSLASESVRKVYRALGPVMVSRGVVQLSAYVDMYFITRIGEQAVAVLGYAQQLSLLPISLFGMAVSASELPEMSSVTGSTEEIAQKLRVRINSGLGRIAFFVVPSVAAFLFLGDVVSGALFQRGHFGPNSSRYAWYVLMGSTLGLLAQTFGRLYSSAFYALKDTRTPFYFALIRVLLTAALAYVSVMYLPTLVHGPKLVGAVGVTATTGMVAWLEFALLRRSLGQRIGSTGFPLPRLLRLWTAAALAGGAGLLIKGALVRHFGPAPSLSTFPGGTVLPAPHLSGLLVGLLVLVPFGLLYFAVAQVLGVSELAPYLGRLRKRRG